MVLMVGLGVIKCDRIPRALLRHILLETKWYRGAKREEILTIIYNGQNLEILALSYLKNILNLYYNLRNVGYNFRNNIRSLIL